MAILEKGSLRGRGRSIQLLTVLAKDTSAFAIVNMYTMFIYVRSPYNCNHHRQKAVIAIFSFDPMWETMRKKGISQYQLLMKEVVDHSTLQRLKKNKNVTLLTVDKICKALECDISQVVRLRYPDEQEDGRLEEAEDGEKGEE